MLCPCPLRLVRASVPAGSGDGQLCPVRSWGARWTGEAGSHVGSGRFMPAGLSPPASCCLSEPSHPRPQRGEWKERRVVGPGQHAGTTPGACEWGGSAGVPLTTRPGACSPGSSRLASLVPAACPCTSQLGLVAVGSLSADEQGHTASWAACLSSRWCLLATEGGPRGRGL